MGESENPHGDKGFSQFPQSFPHFPVETVVAGGRQCGKVRGQERAKKEFSCRFWKKIPQNGFPCRLWRKNTGFSPFLSAFLFEISGKLWYNANILCQNRSFGPGPGHPGGPFSKGKGQVAHLQKDREKRQPEQEPRGADIIAGRNAVSEALRAGRTIDSLYIQRGERSGALSALVAKAKAAGAAIKEADPRKLDHLCGGANHQGVVAVAAVKEYATVEGLVPAGPRAGRAPLLRPLRRAGGRSARLCHHPHGGVRRGPRGHHPQASQRGPDLGGGQSLRRGGGAPARGPGWATWPPPWRS